jgi:hypothetical protein
LYVPDNWQSTCLLLGIKNTTATVTTVTTTGSKIAMTELMNTIIGLYPLHTQLIQKQSKPTEIHNISGFKKIIKTYIF